MIPYEGSNLKRDGDGNGASFTGEVWLSSEDVSDSPSSRFVVGVVGRTHPVSATVLTPTLQPVSMSDPLYYIIATNYICYQDSSVADNNLRESEY